MRPTNAEIIIVGNEVASCVASFTGADVIARELKKCGVEQKSRYYVASEENDVVEALKESFARYDITVLTGCTVTFPPLAAKSIADAAGVGIRRSDEIFEAIRSYARRHDAPVNEEARPFAVVPDGAETLKCGAVPIPGYVWKRDGKMIVVLPGCAENVEVMCETCLPQLFADFVPPYATSRVGFINCKLTDADREAKRICSLIPGLSASVVQSVAEISIDFFADSDEIIRQAIEMLRFSPVGPSIYGVNIDLPTALVRKLTELGHRMATAESCTGGLVAKLITDIPGSSEVFPGGIVSYSNELKMSSLGVSAATLAEHGAVSHQCAVQMAEGIRKKLNVDWAVAITGIAGPGGGTPEKPVGLVYVAVSSRRRTSVSKYNIAGDRENVRNTVAKYAMRSLLTRLAKHSENN